MEKHPAIYIMTNNRHGTLSTGVTSDLIKRIYQHENGLTKGFTQKHGCKSLVYFEFCGDMLNAIAREKKSRVDQEKM